MGITNRILHDKLALLYNHMAHSFPCDDEGLDILKEIINSISIIRDEDFVCDHCEQTNHLTKQVDLCIDCYDKMRK